MARMGWKADHSTPAQLKAMAMVEDQIVPVRIDIEHDHHRIRDSFMWNVSDKIVTPELFAHNMCDDFKVPAQHFAPRIVAAIQERITEYQSHVLPLIPKSETGLLKGQLEENGDGDGKALYETFRRAREGSEEIRTDEGEEDTRIKIVGEDEEVMTVEEAMACIPTDPIEDLRILIKVSRVGIKVIVADERWTSLLERKT